MAINYIRITAAKKSRPNSTAGKDAADYVLRQGRYKNLTEENEDGQKYLFQKIEDNEKIVNVSEQVPNDWKTDNKNFGEQFQQFAKDADDLERKNGATLNKLVLALPRELKTEKEQQAYCQDFLKQTGLDKQAHLAVLHLDPQNHNPHAHILFSARQLNFTCPTKADGSTDKKAYFSRQNPKDPVFGAGDLKQCKSWTNDLKKTNQDLIRSISGLEDWKPTADGKREHHQGRERNNENYKNIVEKNQGIRAERTAANVVSIADDKAQTVSISQVNEHESKSEKELEHDKNDIQRGLQQAATWKRDKNPKLAQEGARLEQELNDKLAKLDAEREKRRNKADKKKPTQQPDHQEPKKSQAGAVLGAPKSHDYGRDMDKYVSLKDLQDRQSKAANNRIFLDDKRHAQQIDAQRDAQARDTEKQQSGTAREADNLFKQMSNTYGEEHTQQARQRFDAMPVSQQADLLNNLPTQPEKMRGERAGDFMNAINYKHEASQEIQHPTWGAGQAQGFITSADKMKKLKPSWQKYATPRPR